MKIGMTGKKHGKSLHKTGRKKTLRKPPNTGIVEEFPSKESSRTENPFREMWIFPPESPEKSGKIMDTERKIFHTAREKARKWFERWGKNARKREAEAEKNRLFLRKEFRKSTENTGMGWKNFSALDKKNIPMKRKNLENGWSGWKNNRAFFAGRQQKNAGKEAGRNQKIYQAYPEKAWKTYGWQG